MKKVRRSASVLLARDWDSPDVYLVLRGIDQRAFPGTWVFPGGRIDSADASVPVLSQDPAIPAEAYAAAARELLEETGVLVALGPNQTPLDPTLLPAHREALLTRTSDLKSVLEDLNATLDGTHLVPLGEKTTPPFHPRRYQNRFFMAVLPQGQTPTIQKGELEEGRWFAAHQAAHEFELGKLLLSPPILLLCETWGNRSAKEALADLQAFDDAAFQDMPIRIRFSPDVILFPGKTATLPPATHTNTYFLGRERLLLIDPATEDESDLPKLKRLVEILAAEGRTIEAIVLSHHHVDHIGSAQALKDFTGAPLWAHKETANRLPHLEFDRFLEDGETHDLGESGTIRFLLTPGHAPGHICLYQEKHRALLAGDMISTASTIVIDPHDSGDLNQYLESLRKLKDLNALVIHPSHGDAYPDANRILQKFLDHRQAREDKIVAALTPAAQSLDQLVARAYQDTPEHIWPLAKISLEAGLIKLSQDGRAEKQAQGWVRTF